MSDEAERAQFLAFLNQDLREGMTPAEIAEYEAKREAERQKPERLERGRRLRAKFVGATPESSPEIAALDSERRLQGARGNLVLDADGKLSGWYRKYEGVQLHWALDYMEYPLVTLCGIALGSSDSLPDEDVGPVYCLACVKALRKLRSG